MLDLIEMSYQCKTCTCYECSHNKWCGAFWGFYFHEVKSQYYSIHYAEGEL